MPSATYRLFEAAMRGRKQILCTYDGYPREICPIILGYKDGAEKSLVFQFGGGGSSPLPPQGDWRCLEVARVRDVRLRDGRWHAGSTHMKSQSCVKDVDLDVNPDSPYRPRRRL
ncbi:hypothetical protein [Chelativorans sp.]|uniref:hypothetical protein n=1 Tax=Chelativorans sp. TaxID=2203393 RepID=UPI002811D4F1|nr:hypothetical protein [Chelativorans sp.]